MTRFPRKSLRLSARSCLMALALVGSGLSATQATAQGWAQLSPRQANVSAEQLGAIIASATPMERVVTSFGELAPQTGTQRTQTAAPGSPMIRRGSAGTPVRAMIDEAESRAAQIGAAVSPQAAPDGTGVTTQQGATITPQNYGLGNQNSIYHYNDYALFPQPYFAPYRSTGLMVFQAANGGWYTCTATLIARAVLLTAGHCVHEGGTGSNAGFITDGWFYPGYNAADGSNQRFGRCRLDQVFTTDDWFNIGNLNGGYDIGMATCGRLEDAAWSYVNDSLPGYRLGYDSFCYANCRWSYQFLTQLGYPGNYYNGGQMMVGQHLEVTGQPVPPDNSFTGTDYIFGSGMRGGSSGGPHISNIGDISQNADDQPVNVGQYSQRNVIFAVTSWGFISNTLQLQGASPLSGLNNDNGFVSLFNQACRRSRRFHGNYSCQLL